MISQSQDKVILRNYEGIICSYNEPEQKSSECQNCGYCKEYSNKTLTGIEKLFREKTISLIPKENNRTRRREEWKDLHS